ncbi:MAG: hypothetical protein HDT38_04735 [Clostridiales bacterium]|nr:hypothetical protein [Clostridiales bacterium]
MAANDDRQKLLQLKQELEKCKKFIKTAQKEAEDELRECQIDYQEACEEVEEIEREYQKDLKIAADENYNIQQIQVMEKMTEEGRAMAKRHKDAAYGYLEKAQEYMEKLPELLELAKEEAESLEKQIALYESTTTSARQMIGGAIIWAIVIFLIFKACGG